MTQEEFYYQCIDVIEHWLNGNRKFSDLEEVTDKLYNEVTKPHWISVEDELPPYKDENKKHSIEVLGWYGENMVDRIYYDYGDEMWFDSFFYRNPPTHWMPLPKMPILSNSGKIGKDLKGGEE